MIQNSAGASFWFDTAMTTPRLFNRTISSHVYQMHVFEYGITKSILCDIWSNMFVPGKCWFEEAVLQAETLKSEATLHIRIQAVKSEDQVINSFKHWWKALNFLSPGDHLGLFHYWLDTVSSLKQSWYSKTRTPITNFFANHNLQKLLLFRTIQS